MLAAISNRARFVWYGLRGRVLSKTIVRHGDAAFRLGTRTAEETHRALSFSTKEPETLDWIDAFTGEDPVFYDVGANVGVYSLYCRAKHPGARIYAFEPEAQSFAALCRNIAINQFAGVQPHQLALAADCGVGTLFVSSLSSGAGAAALGTEYQFMKSRGAPFEQGVCFASIDSLIEMQGLPRPNYLKIDVDGLESEILAGAKGALASPTLRGLLVELQYREEQEIAATLDALASLGFELVRSSDWVASAAGWTSRNFIFARAATNVLPITASERRRAA